MSDETSFVTSLLAWYTDNQRPFPWRDTQDPYEIWVSEVILQQTRVAQGLPYYRQFLARFPTLQALAESDEQTLLRCWQGLGYYARARNMHAAAQQLFYVRKGVFPRTPTELQKIKGIGPYTAAAIASFAFGYVAPVLDGNVFRLLARYFGIHENIDVARNRAVFMAYLERLIHGQDPAYFNQAIMEFGAQQCRPKPRCNTCVLQACCYAFASQQQRTLPKRTPKRPMRIRYLHYCVFATAHGLFMRHRQEKDIWRGLYDFYLKEAKQPLIWAELQALAPECATLVPQHVSRWYKHLLTHQVIMACFFHITLPPMGTPTTFAQRHDLCFFTYEDLPSCPKPVLINNYLQKLEK